MNIHLEGLGKKYNYEWIFKKLNYSFLETSEYAITGSNGSGKSTLAKVIASYTPATEGRITYYNNGKEIPVDKVFNHITYSAPYLELIEEFTLKELFNFHFKFKTPTLGFEEFVERLRLKKAVDKQVKFFSSGMKQRIKLGLAFFSQCSLMILDEPTTNLDAQGSLWYKEEILALCGKRTIIVCSNQVEEYNFCKYYLDIEKMK